MFKNILVPGLNAVCDSKALQLSLETARLFDGQIDCLHVHPDAAELARYTASLNVEASVFSNQIWETMVEADRKVAARSRQVFDAFCAREGLGRTGPVTAAWREAEGAPADRITREAYYSDLVVLGHPLPPNDLTTTGAIDVLVSCGKPLLLAPSQSADGPLSTVVIGWKETAAATRAVTAAMPILAKAQKVHVLRVTEGSEEEGPALASAERLAAYLRSHGLKPQAGCVHADERDACDVLLDAAANKLSGGLLVMGGYSHSRAREFIFGGFTRRVLQRSAPLPVFIVH